MKDFGSLLREALSAEGNYERDASFEAIDAAVRAYQARLRTVRRFGLLVVGGPVVFLVAGLWVYFSPSAGDDHRVLGALLALFGVGASGIGKVWFHGLVNHVLLLREVKVVQLAVAELSERLEASPHED